LRTLRADRPRGQGDRRPTALERVNGPDRLRGHPVRPPPESRHGNDGRTRRPKREGPYIEVYPAAALRLWGLDPMGYKGGSPEARAKRGELVRLLVAAVPAVQFSPADTIQMQESDHAFDALVAALVARGVERGAVLPVPPESMQRARIEGWIRLPTSDALSRLA
jgi:hypothetical protein